MRTSTLSKNVTFSQLLQPIVSPNFRSDLLVSVLTLINALSHVTVNVNDCLQALIRHGGAVQPSAALCHCSIPWSKGKCRCRGGADLPQLNFELC
ncbi:hypothetical protein PILCRDRAFT_625581 [Piloderma croceum F 1598]|uniref:Uncharacterized protein n=1 Tax=Piloderma croceum (strain F 1598) TaxID=765440 RepID=A0A0C3FBK5_PILCF|nr:hypothetical protein PILCRDRAFT_625581 [Piloderma croceum F 1598]